LYYGCARFSRQGDETRNPLKYLLSVERTLVDETLLNINDH